MSDTPQPPTPQPPTPAHESLLLPRDPMPFGAVFARTMAAPFSHFSLLVRLYWFPVLLLVLVYVWAFASIGLDFEVILDQIDKGTFDEGSIEQSPLITILAYVAYVAFIPANTALTRALVLGKSDPGARYRIKQPELIYLVIYIVLYIVAMLVFFVLLLVALIFGYAAATSEGSVIFLFVLLVGAFCAICAYFIGAFLLLSAAALNDPVDLGATLRATKGNRLSIFFAFALPMLIYLLGLFVLIMVFFFAVAAMATQADQNTLTLVVVGIMLVLLFVSTAFYQALGTAALSLSYAYLKTGTLPERN